MSKHEFYRPSPKKCPHCDAEASALQKEPLGEYFIFDKGPSPENRSGGVSKRVEIYTCESCGYVALFAPHVIRKAPQS